MTQPVPFVEVYRCGTTVVIGGTVEATILAIQITENAAVQYLCSWWTEEGRTETWVMAVELTGVDKKAKPARIGFRN
ncbi:MAG: hypothetical protein IT428_17200 [Planctomycetaceae bacterium]|nr:hypothetical protein [Planctomycetaceae bacterium]